MSPSRRWERARRFLSPIEDAALPGLDDALQRGSLILSTCMIWVASLISVADGLRGQTNLSRQLVYSGTFVSIYLLCRILSARRFGHRHAHSLLFTVSLTIGISCLFAAWPSRSGDNLYAAYGLLPAVVVPGFVPVRPSFPLALTLMYALAYPLATHLSPHAHMTHWVSMLPISLVVGLLGALAAQTQRAVLSELHRARTTAEEQAHELEIARNEAVMLGNMKSQFLANVSHEIRTPLTAILGFTELALDELDSKEASQEVCEALTATHRNGVHLVRLINDVLDVSKIEAGQFTLEMQRCSPTQILVEVSDLLGPRAAAKGLGWQMRGADTLPRFIETDATRLRQVLLNLVDNAIKFTHQGRVEVAASARTLDGGENVEITVEVLDSGIGLTPEQLDRVFAPFIQADATMTRRFGGTGLGLTIARRISQLLGGNLTVESTPGAGSRFRMTLRAKLLDSGEQKQSEARAAPSEASLCGRVLLAEDGPDNQRLFSRILSKAGLEVDVAENGRIACDLALAAESSGDPYDVILMDMQMPEMDGYAATAHLRSQGYQRPIYALTAHAMAKDRDRCLEAGCDGYATKPINRQALLDLIRAHVKPGNDPA